MAVRPGGREPQLLTRRRAAPAFGNRCSQDDLPVTGLHEAIFVWREGL